MTGLPTLVAAALAALLLVVVAVLARRLSRTRRALADHALAEEKYRILVNRVPALLWTTDRDLRFTSSEGAGLESLGLDPGQVVGTDLYRYFETDDPAFYPIRRHLQVLDGESAGYDLTWDDRVFQAYLEPLRDDRGRITGVIGLAVDVTESRRAQRALEDSERQLLQAQKMDALGSLAGGIAHDFNNILTPILGYAHLVQQELDADSSLRRDVKQIERAARRARELVRQILAFSRQPGEELRPLELNTVVNESVSLLRASIPTSVRIETAVADKPLRVMAEASQIQQIMLNLGTNAWHAMERTGGILRIGVEPATISAAEADTESGLVPGVFARLSVEDTGAGMPHEVVDRIFEPFFTTKEVGKGAGLGLSVIHGLVTNMHGVVRVDSELGRGSRFDVYLPLTTEAAPDSPPAQQAVPAGHREPVLVVDDEESVAYAVSRLLDRHGYNSTVETDPVLAVERLTRGEHFDVLVTDHSMPGLTGSQLLHKLRADGHDVPAILLTGYRDSIDPEDFGRLGIRRLLMKPLAPGDIERAVHDVLSGR